MERASPPPGGACPGAWAPRTYAYGFFQRVAPAAWPSELMRDFALGGALLGTLSAAYHA